MKYYHIEMGNGYCGFDEEWLMTFEDNVTQEEIFNDAISVYTYEDGGAGLDPYDESEYEDYNDYLDDIADYSSIEEITEEEFNKLKEEIEVR